MKVGRNDPCPCGSGLKYKKCCLAKETQDNKDPGALYAQRYKIRLKKQADIMGIRKAGQLVLETIYLPGEESYACTPRDRYARMRNVWLLPTIAELATWLKRCRYRDIEVVDQSITTNDEQRSTEWMQFDSLPDFLDPSDPSRTVEGYPSPLRAVLIATL